MKKKEWWLEEFERLFIHENVWQGEDEYTKNVAVGNIEDFIRYVVKKMKTLKYKGKCIKMHEDTWKLLKEERIKTGLSWNLFLLKLLNKRSKDTH